MQQENIQYLSIVKFGAERKDTMLCETVNTRSDEDKVWVRLRDHGICSLSLCKSIKHQPIVTVCIQECKHLSQLELTDSCSDSPLVVDVLIRSDYYWEFTTGEIQDGDTGPVDINTKLGWLNSGPVPQLQPSCLQWVLLLPTPWKFM